MKRMHIADAEAQGFTIDYSAAGRPWAYKGARFSSNNSACECYTELETELMALIPVLQAIGSAGSPQAAQARTALANLPQDIVLAAQPS